MVEILKALNPGKNISPIGSIDWTKIKTEKWVWNKDFNEANWQEYVGVEATPESPVYRAKWQDKKEIPVEKTNLLIKRDLEDLGILELAKRDLALIKKWGISSVDKFKSLLENPEFNADNNVNQQMYDSLNKALKK